ncbi:MAG: iron-containing alcohol dehydrogenase [Thalassobaculum sp.]|uniref:iron-containing alcohol dehydrogenase n=1 Tax=Thalassobaculum sp. TaxID=2022740 RepID=UPI0032ED714E
MSATIFGPRIMLIGGGAIGRAPEVLGKLGVSRPLIVSDPFMVSSGLIAALTAPLEAAGIAHGVFSETVPDPTTTVVEAGVAAFKEGGYDGLIGFGGGSPMDTAKAMNILAAHGGRMRDYKVPNGVDTAAVPLVCIPTTAGTGSEVTRGTVITDVETDEKMLVMCLGGQAEAAIVDYELTMKKPFRLTADTGIDSFTHALEAFVSQKRNPYSDSMATAAMQRIGAHLRTACFEPANREAREQMMLGATQAGMAFSNASVALVHGMSRPIGAHFHVPHGLSNAMLLPTVTRWSLDAALDRYAEAGRLIGAAGRGDSDEVAAGKLLDWLFQINQDLEVPSPPAYGIDESKWFGLMETMARQCVASGSHANNPKIPDETTIVELYKQVWGANR